MDTKNLLILLGVVLVVQAQYGEAFPCNVDHCQECSYLNLCGLCEPNYILSINTQTN